jgi:tetratricopeptide (TPR) repeat protein
MFKNRSAVLLGWLVFVAASVVRGQTGPPASNSTVHDGLIKLTGADAKRAVELDKAIGAALKGDRWNEAIAKAEELIALRAKVQGTKHFETMDAEWRLKTLRRVVQMSKEDRLAYESANTMNEQARNRNDKGRYAEAQPLFEKALDIRRRLLTDNHPDTATSYDSVAYNLRAQGKFAAAQPLFENALEIRRRLLTDDHPDTAASYNSLAGNLSYQGKYAAAQPLFEKALEINRRLLTDDHPHTALSYNNLAYNLKAQGKYAAAQPLFEKALEILRRLLTDDHADTAASYNNLAANLSAQGKYAAAQPLYEKALEIHRRLLTDDHPHTALSYNNLAANLNGQGKYALAQPLLEKALEIRRRLLTDDHPVTALSYSNVAHNLSAQGKYAAARPLFEKALEIRRRLLTDNHPDTATSYNDLAHNLNSQGKNSAAQPLFEKALKIYRRLLTDDHPDTATTYNDLASNLNAQGKYAAAQPLFEKALEIRRRLLTDDHPATATSYNDVANNLNAQGRYAAAQPLVEKALETFRRLLTDDHPNTAASYNNLADNLNAQGKYAASQPLYEKALEIHLRLLTDDHPKTALSYNNLAANLNNQGKYALAQPLLEKALEIRRRLLTNDHPDTAFSYSNLAANLKAQGKYAAAQPLYEKALEIRRRLLTDNHAQTGQSYHYLGHNLEAQGKYAEALAQWTRAVRSLDAARLQVAFVGLDRAATEDTVRPDLAAVLARLGQPVQAWQSLEEDLGRGLLDELAARQDRRLAPGDRARLRELMADLERLEKLAETTPKDLDQAGRAQRFADLKRQRELASIALGEFQTKLVQDNGPLAGQAAQLKEIQAALPADAALVAWVDHPPEGPNAADPDGEHWGVVVRSRGIPAWVPMAGTGPKGLWTKDDDELAGRARAALRIRPGAGSADLRSLVEKLRTQRLEPLAKALGASADGLPPARQLIVLPSRALAGIPLEAIVVPGDTRIVSYAPSATVFKYLRERPRPGRHAGLLALGDPVYEQADHSSEPTPPPGHGLLVNMVAPGSNAATHGLKPGDVLLAYNGGALNKKEDLKVVAEGSKPIVVEVWREGRSFPRGLAAGKLGVVLDTRPAPVAIAEQRKLQQLLVAARSGGDGEFAPLPGTRYEVEALADLFKSDDRPTRTLVGVDASEQELERLAASGELGRYGFIHLATHGVIDEDLPARSAVILTQTGLPDPLQQALGNEPVFDGRLSVREIQHDWELKAELVTLSACETALGRAAGGEGFVGFTQALLMSGARSVCLSLWKVDDTATALLMQRFYANLRGRRTGLSSALPKAEALREAKAWLRALSRSDALAVTATLSGGVERGKGSKTRQSAELSAAVPAGGDNDRPYAAHHFWAAFVLAGDPD